MTLATIAQIQTAVLSSISSLTDLNEYDFLPDNFTTPAIIASVGDITYRTAFADGVAEYEVPLLIIVARSSEIAAQMAMDAYRSRSGTNSIWALVKADPTFGGVVGSSYLAESKPQVAISINGAEYLAAEFTLTVYA